MKLEKIVYLSVRESKLGWRKLDIFNKLRVMKLARIVLWGAGKSLMANIKERDHLRIAGVDGRIILKWTSVINGVRVWI